MNPNARPQPNIVFIYTDDQAAWATGFSGNPQARTPHLDGLASEGASFTNCFVTTPVCSPARASLMTSRFATELGIPDFIPQPGHRFFDSQSPIGLDPAIPNFAEVLSDVGYTTGLVGKWHLGDWTQAPDRRYHPTTNGFDTFMGLTGGGTTPSNPPLEEEGEVRQFEGLTTDILTDRAVQFIRRRGQARGPVQAGSPFLLCLNYRAPHKEWLPVAEADWESYRDMVISIPDPDYPDLDIPLVTRMMREYLASVAGVDRNVGRVLGQLDELGLADDTVVIFSSDNGYNMGHNGIWHKGNGIWATRTTPPDTENINGRYRPNLYDHSLRVPGIIRWPRVIQPGTVIDRTVSNLDWYPTIADMARAPVPQGDAVRGRSLLPLLRGERVDDWDNDFFAEYNMQIYCRTHMRAYRTADWKLVRDFLNPERDELYDMVIDPDESSNLINSDRPRAREAIEALHQSIIEKMKDIADPLLRRIDV